MFTGIVETTGIVESIERDGSNIHFWIESGISSQCKIDQSVSHNGVCLTLTSIRENSHRVTAIQETLGKTNLGYLQVKDVVNLERCLKLGDRLDGHMVQGHIDGTAECIERNDLDGSWSFRFRIEEDFAHLVVHKGSICINGVSLTANNPGIDSFEVAIIPYTMVHTNFKSLMRGDTVNIEFDIIGKYLERYKSLETLQIK